MTLLGNIIVGLSTGALSSFMVYVLTKRREGKYQTYQFWYQFLLNSLMECEIYFPAEALQLISAVGEKDSEWYKTIYAIFDDIRPFELEDREFTDREERLAKNILTALTELEKWRKKNHLH